MSVGARLASHRWTGRLLAAAAASVALIASSCTASPSARLAKDLIAPSTLQSSPWNLRVTSKGRTLNPFGLGPSGAPIAPANLSHAKAVATRQWVRDSGALVVGPLPDGIFSVIDAAAHFAGPADAQALVTDLSNGYGTASSGAAQGSANEMLLTAPFTANVAGGQVTGHEDLVIITRGPYVFTVLTVGGGSRPTPDDAQALAALQTAAIPASLS